MISLIEATMATDEKMNIVLLETYQAMHWFSRERESRKKAKMAIMKYLSTALRLWEITASFISHYWKYEENTPVNF